jgi:hypothetical protein
MALSHTKHSGFTEVLAPRKVEIKNPSIFLAGSIEMGKAKLWQNDLTEQLSDLGITVLNPRRPDWNLEWEQSISFRPFKEQVDWEMDHLEKADVIALYFQPGTMSPISLLELGLHARSGKIVLHCPEGYLRKGNVDILAERYGIQSVTTFEDLVKECRVQLQRCIDKRAGTSRQD